jgi:hypothetical protein
MGFVSPPFAPSAAKRIARWQHESTPAASTSGAKVLDRLKTWGAALCTVQPSTRSQRPGRAGETNKGIEMVHASANAPCETFARVIGRLSLDIQRLTREIPLRQGCLQELESRPPLDPGAIQGVAEEIRAALDDLRQAENDLVQMEILFRMNCCASAA